MAVREYKSVRGTPIESMDMVRYVGTTSVLANDPLVKRPVSVNKKIPLVIQPEGEGVYVENNVTLVEGYNFPIAEAVVEAGAVTYQKLIHLGGNIVVGAFVDGDDSSKGKVRCGEVDDGGTVSWGDVAVFNDAATTDIGLTRINATTFAISYIDDGGDDYLGAMICTIDTSTYAITKGTEKLLVSAAIAKTTGTDCCIPRSGVLFVGYILDADKKGYGIAATFSGTTIATPGTAVEFDGGADTKGVSCCSHDTGDVTVVYQAGGDANDPIMACCGTVSALGAIVFGNEVSMAGTAAAATSISCLSPEVDIVVFTWIDSTFAHINSMSISGTTPTKKTELELTAAATLTPSIAMIEKDRFVVVVEDDSHSADVGKVFIVTRSSYTFTKSTLIGWFTPASTAAPRVCELTSPDDDSICIFFDDAGDSNKGKVIVGHYKNNLIDVRSNVNSAAYVLWTTPRPGRKRSA